MACIKHKDATAMHGRMKQPQNSFQTEKQVQHAFRGMHRAIQLKHESDSRHKKK